MVERPHAAAGGHLDLARDVALARRVVADEHDRESRRDAAVAGEAMHGIGNLAAQIRQAHALFIIHAHKTDARRGSAWRQCVMLSHVIFQFQLGD